jgi:hypothetical protein
MVGLIFGNLWNGFSFLERRLVPGLLSQGVQSVILENLRAGATLLDVVAGIDVRYSLI